MTIRSKWMLCVLASALVLGGAARVATQIRYASGQNVVAVFEGWDKNADGSFNMVFGYLNRNYEEEMDIPIGPNNMFEPGDVDQGQPTHFYLRRQQFMFKVRVPKDWGKKDLIWTLTSRGKTEKAYASLLGFKELGLDVYQQNRGGPTLDVDEAPSITLVGATKRTIPVSEALPLTAQVSDDGLPPPRGRGAAPGQGAPQGRGTAAEGRGTAAPLIVSPRVENPLNQMVVRLDPGRGLGVIWVVHRRSGKGRVTFDPMKVAVTDGKASTIARFDEPGTYVLRGYADDSVLLNYVDVTVTVTGNAGR